MVTFDPLPGSFAELAQIRSRTAAAKVPDAARSAAPAPGVRLPCLNRNNSNETILTGAQRRTAFALSFNVESMAKKHGIECLLFNTLTFRDHITDIREAQRRFNSLRTGVLKRRYLDFIVVVERQKSGRIHYHILAATAHDMRTGFSFEAAAAGDYRSACAALRAEWAFWRATAREYGFGRTEQMPVKSTAEGISKYVGKYIQKHIDKRREDDKGARLVRYSDGARAVSTRFAWANGRGRVWRQKLSQFATRHHVWSIDMMNERFGPHWAFKLSERIAAEVIS